MRLYSRAFLIMGLLYLLMAAFLIILNVPEGSFIFANSINRIFVAELVSDNQLILKEYRQNFTRFRSIK